MTNALVCEYPCHLRLYRIRLHVFYICATVQDKAHARVFNASVQETVLSPDNSPQSTPRKPGDDDELALWAQVLDSPGAASRDLVIADR